MRHPVPSSANVIKISDLKIRIISRIIIGALCVMVAIMVMSYSVSHNSLNTTRDAWKSFEASRSLLPQYLFHPFFAQLCGGGNV